jgi:hypothetical protein
MTVLYVLDIPEFAPLREIARVAGMSVERTGSYWLCESSEPRVVLERAASPVRLAVWYAALTAGFDGTVVSHDDDRLLIEAEPRSAEAAAGAGS